jgi:hypothetical protein
MKTLTKYLIIGSAALVAMGLSSTAAAGTVVCPESDAGDQMTLSNITGGPPTCAASGWGPQEIVPGNPPLLWKIDFDGMGGIDETSGTGPNPFLDFTGGDGHAGLLELMAGLTDHQIAFKFGQGQSNPNWFVFDINGMTFANWSFSGQNALSHVGIYGPPPVDIPEPMTLALLGLGLVAAGYRARRRQLC